MVASRGRQRLEPDDPANGIQSRVYTHSVNPMVRFYLNVSRQSHSRTTSKRLTGKNTRTLAARIFFILQDRSRKAEWNNCDRRNNGLLHYCRKQRSTESASPFLVWSYRTVSKSRYRLLTLRSANRGFLGHC